MESVPGDRTRVYPWSRTLGYQGEIAVHKDLVDYGMRHDWTNSTPGRPEKKRYDFLLLDTGVMFDVKTRPEPRSDLIFVNVNQLGGRYFTAVRRLREATFEVCGWVEDRVVMSCGTYQDEKDNDGRKAYRVPFTLLSVLPWWRPSVESVPHEDWYDTIAGM